MSAADDLRRAQAFNAALVRYIHALIETTKRLGAPDAPTLIFACETMLKLSAEAAAAVPETRTRYECPRCGAVSYNPRDAAERYCVRCHEFAEP